MKRALYSGLVILVLTAGYLWLDRHRTNGADQELAIGRERYNGDAARPSKGSSVNFLDEASQVEPKKPQALPFTLNAGSLSMKLAFEDGDADPELAQFILTDLNLILGHLGESEFLAPDEKAVPVPINGQLRPVSSVINYVGKGRFIPDRLEPFLGRIIENQGRKEFVVGKEIQALYRAAHAGTQKHPGVLGSLPDFIARLNRLSEEPPASLGDVIYFGNLSTEESKALAGFGPAQLVQAFGGKQYRAPSVLEIQASPTLDATDATAWTAPLFIVVENGISDAAPTAIYQNGQWKLLLSSTTL